MAESDFTPLYPDVLGLVTGGTRVSLDALQFALGIFPKQVFVNQPFEALLILQNRLDAELPLKIAVRLPSADRSGGVVVVDTPQAQIALKLPPGEVGVLHLPLVVRPPTQPGNGFPVRVTIRARMPEVGRLIRTPTGGVAPSVLSISPFKLQALREVTFSGSTWNAQHEVITAAFDVAPMRIGTVPEMPQTRYEPLWTYKQMEKERELVLARVEDARTLAQSSLYSGCYPALKREVKERFAARGMPLHPGEVMGIAKMMAYAVDESPILEQIDVERTRWFMALCQVLAADPELYESVDRNEIIATHVFDEVLYESIILGFRVLQTKVRENLGNQQERIEYTNRVLNWWGGNGDADLSYVYLPLAMAGLSVHRLVRHATRENPWEIIDNLEEAMNGRIRLADSANVVIFEMLAELLDQAKRGLTAQRIQRE
jgi:hypothetical protein